MKSIALLLGLFIYILSSPIYAARDTVTFLSGDGIKITADTYIAHENKNTPLLVLFHQAGWSRGEYLEIAPKLNALGFNCIAIDQRSGKSVNGIENETALSAKQAGKNIRYVDALPDIEAALRYAKSQYNESKIIAWGSSYSAALVLHIAGTLSELVDGVLAFSPGEYFPKQGKSKSWIQDAAANISAPVLSPQHATRNIIGRQFILQSNPNKKHPSPLLQKGAMDQERFGNSSMIVKIIGKQ